MREQQRVLVVDDHVHGAEVLALGLQSCGFAVRHVNDGLAALETAVEFRPHIVLLDLALPILNGWEVARRLRCMPFFKQPRLIALSALTQPAHRARSLAAGFECHLAKPVTLDEVRRVLQTPPN
jgi:CheY-like chemotaxis protein